MIESEHYKNYHGPKLVKCILGSENITDKIVDFKLHVYEKIKEELKKLI